MSKGNLFLGYGRGSVGDITFSRNNGQQVTRARNRKPNNPKTVSQMLQRSLFIDATKFYQQATGGFFKFAFEDKRSYESDYNAFMRVNVANGVNLSKGQFDNRQFPALGEWLLSKGSLLAPVVGSESNEVYFEFGLDDPNIIGSYETVGQLSEIMLRNPGYATGDMITIVNYGYDTPAGDSINNLAPAEGTWRTWFRFYQFILDRNSSELLSKYHIYKVEQKENDDALCAYIGGIDENHESYAVIHTRNVSGGVMASNSYLYMSGGMHSDLTALQEQSQIELVLNAWKSNGEAILDPKSQQATLQNLVVDSPLINAIAAANSVIPSGTESSIVVFTFQQGVAAKTNSFALTSTAGDMTVQLNNMEYDGQEQTVKFGENNYLKTRIQTSGGICSLYIKTELPAGNIKSAVLRVGNQMKIIQ